MDAIVERADAFEGGARKVNGRCLSRMEEVRGFCEGEVVERFRQGYACCARGRGIWTGGSLQRFHRQCINREVSVVAMDASPLRIGSFFEDDLYSEVVAFADWGVGEHVLFIERRFRLIVLTPDVVQGQGVCGRRHALGIDLTPALEVVEYLREPPAELRDVIVAQANSRQPRDVLYLLFGKGQ